MAALMVHRDTSRFIESAGIVQGIIFLEVQQRATRCTRKRSATIRTGNRAVRRNSFPKSANPAPASHTHSSYSARSEP